MPTGLLNMLDIATRSGDQVHALIEGVLTAAPELRTVPIITKAGITYTTLTRTGLPSGDFAKIGAGVAPQKSQWKRELGSMAKFEAQMRVPQDVLTVARSEAPDLTDEDVLSDEALAYVRGSAIRIGSQFYYGPSISPDGFAGLSTQVDPTNNEIDAGGGAGVDSSSAYLVYYPASNVNPDGVHFVMGNNGRMSFDDTWFKQQIPDPNDATHTKFTSVFCNDFLAFMGLVLPRQEAVYRIKNITDAKPFNDALAASLLRKVPLALRGDLSRWKWHLNSSALFQLQASRSTVNVATGGNKGVGNGGVYADVPTTCQQIAILPTDSILSTERNGLHP